MMRRFLGWVVVIALITTLFIAVPTAAENLPLTAVQFSGKVVSGASLLSVGPEKYAAGKPKGLAAYVGVVGGGSLTVKQVLPDSVSDYLTLPVSGDFVDMASDGVGRYFAVAYGSGKGERLIIYDILASKVAFDYSDVKNIVGINRDGKGGFVFVASPGGVYRAYMKVSGWAVARGIKLNSLFYATKEDGGILGSGLEQIGWYIAGNHGQIADLVGTGYKVETAWVGSDSLTGVVYDINSGKRFLAKIAKDGSSVEPIDKALPSGSQAKGYWEIKGVPVLWQGTDIYLKTDAGWQKLMGDVVAAVPYGGTLWLLADGKVFYLDKPFEVSVSYQGATEIEYGSAASYKGYVVISTTGSGSALVDCSADAGWIKLSPASFEINGGETKKVEVTIDTSGITQGDSEQRLQGTITCHVGSYKDFSQTLTLIVPPKAFEVSVSYQGATEVSYDSAASYKGYVVFTATGSGKTQVSCESDAGWIKLSPTSFEIKGGETKKVEVTLDVSGIEQTSEQQRLRGNITCHIGGQDDFSQSIVLIVPPKAQWQVEGQTEVHFREAFHVSVRLRVKVQKAGEVVCTADRDWLKVSPDRLSVSAGSDVVINVSYDPSSKTIKPGTFYDGAWVGHITCKAPGMEEKTFTFRLTAKSALMLWVPKDRQSDRFKMWSQQTGWREDTVKKLSQRMGVPYLGAPWIHPSYGRTYLPLRLVGMLLGLNVDYDAKTKTAILTAEDGLKIEVPLGGMKPRKVKVYGQMWTVYEGKPQIVINGQAKQIDAPAVIVNGRTYLPVRAIAEAMGALVLWDGSDRRVEIYR